MDTLAFEHHLTSPQGRGRIPEQGFAATVGGFACCDEISITVSLGGDRVDDAGFEASGCGAATAAGSAAVTPRPRGAAARRRARRRRRDLRGARRAERRQAPRRRARRRRARPRTRRGRAGAGRARRAGRGGRTLVAMSGGVDSAVAALLSSPRPGDGGGHARAVVGSGERRRAELLLGHGGRAGAGARALDGPAALHDRPAQRVSRRGRRAVRRRVRGAARPRIRASGATATSGSTRCSTLADRLGCDSLATGHYARVAERDHELGPLLRVAADPAKDQSYMLAALAPASLARLRLPLGELEQARGQADRGRRRAPGREQGRLPGPLLPGGHRSRAVPRPPRAARRCARASSSTAAAPSSGATTGQHLFTVGQRRGLRIAGGEPRFVLDKDAVTNRVTVGPARGAVRDSAGPRSAARQLRREGCRVDRVKLRYRSQPIGAQARRRARPPAATRGSSSSSSSRRTPPPRPARVPDGRRARRRLGHDHPAPAERVLRDLEVRVLHEHRRVLRPVLAGRRRARERSRRCGTDRRTLRGWSSTRTCRRSGSRSSWSASGPRPAVDRVAEHLVAGPDDVPRHAAAPGRSSPVLTTKCLPPVIREIWLPYVISFEVQSKCVALRKNPWIFAMPARLSNVAAIASGQRVGRTRVEVDRRAADSWR